MDSCISTQRHLGRSLYDLSKEAGNEILYALTCSYYYFAVILCNKHYKLVLAVFYMVNEYKLHSQSSLTSRIVKKTPMLRNRGIDGHGNLSRLNNFIDVLYSRVQQVRNSVSAPLCTRAEVHSMSSYCPCFRCATESRKRLAHFIPISAFSLLYNFMSTHKTRIIMH